MHAIPSARVRHAMKQILVLILAALLVFGCTGGAPQAKQGAGNGTKQGGTPGGAQPQGSPACTPQYSFSDLPDGTLSGTTHLLATATCAAGRKVAVMLDGAEVASASAATNETSPLDLAFAPRKDGTVKLTVESGGATLLSKDWTVAPLGNSDTKGVENDAVSFKEWRAMSFTAGSGIRPSKVNLFLKRLQYRTQPGTMLALDIRSDNGGSPGAILATAERPINATTLSDNWVAFGFERAPSLPPGTYWAVLRVEQTEDVALVSDVVNLHYVVVDRQSPGNGYTRQMILDVDQKTGAATQTAWAPLAYDRAYSITIHGAG